MSAISRVFGLQLWNLAVLLILTRSFSWWGSFLWFMKFMLISSRHICIRSTVGRPSVQMRQNMAVRKTILGIDWSLKKRPSPSPTSRSTQQFGLDNWTSDGVATNCITIVEQFVNSGCHIGCSSNLRSHTNSTAGSLICSMAFRSLQLQIRPTMNN